MSTELIGTNYLEPFLTQQEFNECLAYCLLIFSPRVFKKYLTSLSLWQKKWHFLLRSLFKMVSFLGGKQRKLTHYWKDTRDRDKILGNEQGPRGLQRPRYWKPRQRWQKPLNVPATGVTSYIPYLPVPVTQESESWRKNQVGQVQATCWPLAVRDRILLLQLLQQRTVRASLKGSPVLHNQKVTKGHPKGSR